MSEWPVTGLLEGKGTIVTGAGKGIGRACALEFPRQGALLTLCDVDDELGRATAEACGARYVHADVSVSAEANALADAAAGAYGGTDCLFSCAGTTRTGT